MNEIEESRIEKINRLHSENVKDATTMLNRAIEIGGELSEQKENMNHGEFIPWIEENVSFAERTARDYMKFYRYREELKTARLADLTQARKAIYQIEHKKNSDDGTAETEFIFVSDDEEYMNSLIREKNKAKFETEKLKDNIKELKKAPDIAAYLEGCIQRQSDTNGVLKEVFENREYLSVVRLQKLLKLLLRSIQIVQENIPDEDVKMLSHAVNE